MQDTKSRPTTETPETLRSDYFAVLTESGPILLADRPTVARQGILVGEEPDGSSIYIRDWSRVWNPTVDRLRHMAVSLPARQKALLNGGEAGAGPARNFE